MERVHGERGGHLVTSGAVQLVKVQVARELGVTWGMVIVVVRVTCSLLV